MALFSFSYVVIRKTSTSRTTMKDKHINNHNAALTGCLLLVKFYPAHIHTRESLAGLAGAFQISTPGRH